MPYPIHIWHFGETKGMDVLRGNSACRYRIPYTNPLAASKADLDELKSVRKRRRRIETTLHDNRHPHHQTALRPSPSPLHRSDDTIDLLALACTGIPDARLQRKGPAGESESVRHQRYQNSRVDRAGYVEVDGSDQPGSLAVPASYTCRRKPAFFKGHLGCCPNGGAFEASD